MSVWFITGASRGLGLEIAKAALAQGDSVVATARDPRGLEAFLPDNEGRLFTVTLDVTDEVQAVAAVKAAVDRFGGIDVLVNNAGRGWSARSRRPRTPRPEACSTATSSAC